jgi:DNA-binding MarR family transcriptional regulator
MKKKKRKKNNEINHSCPIIKRTPDVFYARLDRFYRKMNRTLNLALDRYGLSPSQLLLLNVVGEKKIANAKEIGENMDLDSASVAGLTARLQKKKLLRKIKDPKIQKDRRFSQFCLTTLGKEMQSAGAFLLEKFDLKMGSSLSMEEKELFRNMLERIEQEWVS